MKKTGLPGGLEALLHKDRRRANLKNRVEEAVEQAMTAFALENPAAGQVRVSNELRKRGIEASPTGVRSVWLRHSLHTFRLRLATLEKTAAEEGNMKGVGPDLSADLSRHLREGGFCQAVYDQDAESPPRIC